MAKKTRAVKKKAVKKKATKKAAAKKSKTRKKKVRVSKTDLTSHLRRVKKDASAKDDVNIGDDVAKYQDGLDIPPN